MFLTLSTFFYPHTSDSTSSRNVQPFKDIRMPDPFDFDEEEPTGSPTENVSLFSSTRFPVKGAATLGSDGTRQKVASSVDTSGMARHVQKVPKHSMLSTDSGYVQSMLEASKVTRGMICLVFLGF